jgi:hypothetical protein
LATFRLIGDPPGELDEARIDLDADAPRAVFLRRDDRQPPIARSEVVNDIVGRHVRESQHRIGDVMACRREMDVGRARRQLNSKAALASRTPCEQRHRRRLSDLPNRSTLYFADGCASSFSPPQLLPAWRHRFQPRPSAA